MIQALRPVGIARVAATTALEAKKKGKGGGNNEGAQPREPKEKDDVIEVGRKRVAPHPSSTRIDRLKYSANGVTWSHLPHKLNIALGATGVAIVAHR